MAEKKIVQLEDRVPKLKIQRRKRANRRFYVLVFILSCLIVGVAYLQSPFSRVQDVEINGNVLATDEDIIQSLSIQKGDNIWGMKKEAIVAELKEQPEIKNAEVERKLPSTIIITVEEYLPVAFLMKESKFIPILETGQPLQKRAEQVQALDAPLLSNFTDDDTRKLLVDELSKLDASVRSSISEIVYKKDKNNASSITMFMNDGYEVRGTIDTFREKLDYYPTIISQLDPDVRGYIDLEVGAFFTSYEPVKKKEEEEDEEAASE